MLTSRMAEETHEEKAADEPRPAPTGSVDRMLRWKEGLERR